MNPKNLKFYIQVRFKIGLAITINEIFKELKTALPQRNPSLSTVNRWFNQFKRGVDDLKDKHRKGRSITETIHANIERVRVVIENDPWCTYDEIEAETALSRGTIEAIIMEHLKMKKLANKSCVAEGEKAKTVVKIGSFESKNLLTIFFRTSGVVHVSYLDKGKTMNHHL